MEYSGHSLTKVKCLHNMAFIVRNDGIPHNVKSAKKTIYEGYFLHICFFTTFNNIPTNLSLTFDK